MLQILNGVIGLGCLICFIIVLVRLFQENGVLHGILGLNLRSLHVYLGLD
jgi:hypothetical protein